jgi:L-ascorbate metabolism protein UlaG (beta-lactamase superfamily)
MLDLDALHWLGHSGIRITGTKTIVIDPYHIAGREPADIILITHEHYDHMSLEDIQKIRTDKTTFIVPYKNAGQFAGQVIGMKPGDQIEVDAVSIQAVPAYNIGKSFHPRERLYMGYIIIMDETSLYHAGDTDLIPEMREIKTDVAFLPVSGTYTMNAQEAAEAAEIIRPKLAVPIHWGSVAGYRTDAEQFHRLSQVRSMILEQENQ